ncbi:MAG TPA: WD40 repeat domain-containing protein, partial [Polyangia bacterium]|nr:WD40 repeat domain-containing protein [Polyangia bacterium]
AVMPSRTTATVFFGTASGAVLRWNVDEPRAQPIGRQRLRVDGLRVAQDEHFVATAAVGEVDLWNLRDGSVRRFPGPPHEVGTMEPAGDTLFFIGSDGNLMRTDVAVDSPPRVVGRAVAPTRMSVSNDGRFVALGDRGGMITVWPVAGGAPTQIRTGVSAVDFLRFVPGSDRLAAVGADRVATLWDVSGRLIQQLPAQPQQLLRLDVAPDGSNLALAGVLGAVTEWDPTTGYTRPLTGHAGMILTHASGRRRLVISGGADRETRVWSDALRQPEPLRVLRFGDDVMHAALSPDGARVVVDGTKTPHLCELATGLCRDLVGHTALVYGIEFSPDGTRVLTAGWDGTARVWDVATGAARVFRLGGVRANWAVFTPDGQHIVVAGSDGPVYVWPVAGGEPTILRGHAHDATAVAVSPDGNSIVSGGDDHTVRLWDRPSGRGRILGTVDASVTVVDVSPDGRRVVAGDYDGSVRLWSLGDGASQTVVRFHDAISKVSFSPDNRSLAASSIDGGFSILDLASGHVDVIREHEDRVRGLAWSPDSRKLATASNDGTARLWDRRTGAVEVLLGHKGTVRRVLFSSDGTRLFTVGSDDDVVRVWDATITPSVPRDPAQLAAFLSTLTSATVP